MRWRILKPSTKIFLETLAPLTELHPLIKRQHPIGPIPRENNAELHRHKIKVVCCSCYLKDRLGDLISRHLQDNLRIDLNKDR